jgi:hypothetical protein
MRSAKEGCVSGPTICWSERHGKYNACAVKFVAQGRGHSQELLLFAGQIADLLRLTGPTRGRIVSLKMEGILFQGILAWVIRCYQ